MWWEHTAGPEGDRAQVFTLEGVFAALVIMVSVLFALQTVTAVPGGGGSVSTGANENVAQSALSAVDDETIRGAILYWSSSGGFHCTPSGTEYYPAPPDSLASVSCSGSYPGSLPPTEFGAVLSDQLGGGYQYNVVLKYGTASGPDVESQRMVYRGQPGAGAVRARTSVPLANDDEFRAEDGTRSSTTLADEPNRLYAGPLDGDAGDDDLYNVIHVEVVAWQS